MVAASDALPRKTLPETDVATTGRSNPSKDVYTSGGDIVDAGPGRAILSDTINTMATGTFYP